MPPNIMLQTERTLLSLLTEEDLPAMEEMAREPDTFKYLKVFRMMSGQEYTQFLHTKLEQIRSKTGYHWAVRLKTDHRFVGAINLNRITGTTRMQIGCQLKRDCWGQGFASELTHWLLEYAIHELKLPVVYGVFDKENDVSRRLLEKLGFVFEEMKTSHDTQWEVHKYISPIP